MILTTYKPTKLKTGLYSKHDSNIMATKISLILLISLFGEILSRQPEYRPFYQSGRSWKSKPERMDFVKDHNEPNRFRPPGFQKYVDRKRKEAMMYPPYVNMGLRQESVKELIQKGRFLNAGYVSSEIPLAERMKREGQARERGASVSIMNEISSVEVLPIIRRSRTIECQRDPDGVVNCHQDDLHYKIRLKHPDLPQDVLETLITNLYARLFKVTTDKKKRDGTKNSQKPTTEESPFIIVLPPDHVEPARTGQNSRPIGKIHSSTDSSNGDDLIIECSPAEDIESLKDMDKTSLREDGPKSYVYSCKWHGKRSPQQQKIIVEKVRRGPPLQSFKVLIDPAKVGLNLLPITVMNSRK